MFLQSAKLAGNITKSNLTEVGTLNSGSIAEGFGNIDIKDNKVTAKTLECEEIAAKNGTVYLNANLLVQGSATQINVEQINLQNNMIVINSGFSGIPQNSFRGGIEVNRGQETDYQFLFLESKESFVIGLKSDANEDLQSVATREDNPQNNGLAFWNAEAYQFQTNSSLTTESLVTKSDTQTLNNKTLTNPIIEGTEQIGPQISSPDTLTLNSPVVVASGLSISSANLGSTAALLCMNANKVMLPITTLNGLTLTPNLQTLSLSPINSYSILANLTNLSATPTAVTLDDLKAALHLASTSSASFQSVEAETLSLSGVVTSGIWNGSVIDGAYGGTGVANANKTITLGGNLTTVGHNLTLTLTGSTNVTLPTSGTVVTLDASQVLTNKQIDASQLTGTIATNRMPALTGDVTSSVNSVSTTIASGAVTLGKMANLAANSLIGNNTGSSATPLALSASQVKALLAITQSDVSGLTTSSTPTFAGLNANGSVVINNAASLTVNAGADATSFSNPSIRTSNGDAGALALNASADASPFYTRMAIQGRAKPGVNRTNEWRNLIRWDCWSGDGGVGHLTNMTIFTHANDGVNNSMVERMRVTSNTTATSTSSATVQVTGGLGVTGAVFCANANISSLTPNRIIATDANDDLITLDTSTYPSLTELERVKGVTSSIQTQLDSKENAITAGLATQYWTGNKTWAVLNQAAVAGLTTLSTPSFAGITTSGSITINGNRTITLGGNLTTVGHNLTLTLSGSTNVTLPTSGTVVTLDASQVLTNKQIDASQLTGTIATNRMPALTGDVTSSVNSVSTTIASGAVTLGKMANLAANSLIGNNTGSSATPLALSASQVKALLAITQSDVSGLTTSSTPTFAGLNANGSVVINNAASLTVNAGADTTSFSNPSIRTSNGDAGALALNASADASPFYTRMAIQGRAKPGVNRTNEWRNLIRWDCWSGDGGVGHLTNMTIFTHANDGVNNSMVERMRVTSNTTATSTSSATVQVTGGLGVTGAVFCANANISSLTPNRITATDANDNLITLDTSTYPSLTELERVKGVTSNIQTQLDSKENAITAGLATQYWTGNKTWAVLNQAAVTGLTSNSVVRFAGLDLPGFYQIASTNNVVTSANRLVAVTVPYTLSAGGSAHMFLFSVELVVANQDLVGVHYQSSFKLRMAWWSSTAANMFLISRSDSTSSFASAIEGFMDTNNIYFNIQLPTSTTTRVASVLITVHHVNSSGVTLTLGSASTVISNGSISGSSVLLTQSSTFGPLSCRTLRTNDDPIYFRTSNDTNHGVQHTTSWGGFARGDGPVIYGLNSVLLGTTNGSNKPILSVDSNNRVGINYNTTFGATEALRIIGVTGATDGIGIKTSVETNNQINFYNQSNNLKGWINSSNSTSVAYVTSSDRRLKTNIQPMPNMLEKIKQLKPSTFEWKDNGDKADGFIAQEVYQVFPSMLGVPRCTDCCTNNDVYEGKLCCCVDWENPKKENGEDFIYGLDYAKFTPYLTKAIQELADIVEQQKQQIQVQHQMLLIQQQQINELREKFL